MSAPRPRRPADRSRQSGPPGDRRSGPREGSGPTRPPRRRPAAPAPPREDLVYGRNTVLEAARAGRLRRVLIATGHGQPRDERLDEIVRLAAAGAGSRRAAVEEVAVEVLDRLAPGGVHQGVVAEVAPRRYDSLKDVLASRPTLLVALDSILDPQNLGAILRSAEAAGADAAILPERRSAPISAATAKASAGASEHVRLCKVPGLPSAISEIRRAQIWCLALDPRGEMLPWEFDFTQPVCVIVGGEGQGVHRLLRERADARVRLPMAGRVASLNASAAAAALLYEVARQRAAASPR